MMHGQTKIKFTSIFYLCEINCR